MPDGDLLERIEKAPPGARRRLARLDTAVLGVCATTPLELGEVLAGLAAEAADGDEGRIDTDRAWESVVGARDAHLDAAPDATAERLLALAHAALGLESPCQACADWQPEDADAEDEADDETDETDKTDETGVDDEDDEAAGEADDDDHDHDHDHDAPSSLLGRVFDVHADALDTWPGQVALRVASDAGAGLADVAGFDVLHDVVGTRRAVDGVSNEQRGELHVVQHVGMSLCVDAAQIHALVLAYPRLAAEGASAADAMDEAERVAAEESGVMAAVIASVVVDRLAPLVEETLASAPPQGPPSRRPRNRRRSR